MKLIKTILFLDDDIEILNLFSDLLTEEGFTVLSEANSTWALKTLKEKPVDLLITDVLVPGEFNGFDLIDKMQELETIPPSLIVSGAFRRINHWNNELKAKGVVDYVDKPLRTDQLIEILKKHFGDEYPDKPSIENVPEATENKITSALEDESLEAEVKNDEASIQEANEVENSRVLFKKGMIVRGDLESTPLPNILNQLYHWKANGALMLERDKVKKIIYFKNGYPIFVKSNLLRECLGQLLVSERLISKEDCAQSVKKMKKSHLQQGTILIQMGLLSPHNLVFTLEKQLLLKLLEIFKWSNGSYQYNSQIEPPPVTVNLNCTPSKLIFMGIKRFYNRDKINNLIPKDLSKTFQLRPEAEGIVQGMGLPQKLQAWARNFTGEKTVSELLESPEAISNQKAHLSLFTSLFVCDQLKEITKRKESKVAPPPPELKTAPKDPDPIEHSEELYPEIPSMEAPESSFRQVFSQTLQMVESRNFFERLGLNKENSEIELEKSYRSLAALYHPDKYIRLSDEIRGICQNIFSLLSEAHESLSSSEGRDEYEKSLIGGLKNEASEEVKQIIEAEKLFKKACSLMDKDMFEDAHPVLQEATQLYPEESEYHSTLGWCTFRIEHKKKGNAKKAIDLIQKGIGINPSLDKNYLYLGYINKYLEKFKEAERNFEKAIQCNPECREALSELKLLDIKKRKEKKQKKKKSWFPF